MQRFFKIKEKKNDKNFIGMGTFWKSIKQDLKTTDQKKYSPFEDELDLFYICSLVGLKLKLKENDEDYNLTDLTDTWTKNLSEKSKAKQYILAMLLNITTKNHFNNKNKIQEIMNSFLDSTSSTSLSASGLKELHQYCFGGYKRILKECGNDTPSSLVVFLNKVKKILD
jgi:hypothetical protein|tara:strand:- start:263 stop:769 length:507 start_codon:yes stop_codon:yes gene_type:complete